MRSYEEATCPACGKTVHTNYVAGFRYCPECGANTTELETKANQKDAREINAAVSAGHKVTAWRHFPKSPSRVDEIDKARGGRGGLQVRWYDSHKWQNVKRQYVTIKER